MTFDWTIVARAAHVLGVVIWIGGVGFVTAVLLPAIRAMEDPHHQANIFEHLESKFAWTARAMVLLVGISGLYMLWALDLWDRFIVLQFWWMHAMVAIWTVFAAILFIAEPLFLHQRFKQKVRTDPQGTFKVVQRLHWALLAASLITVAGAVAGAHGLSLFDP